MEEETAGLSWETPAIQSTEDFTLKQLVTTLIKTVGDMDAVFTLPYFVMIRDR